MRNRRSTDRISSIQKWADKDINWFSFLVIDLLIIKCIKLLEYYSESKDENSKIILNKVKENNV